MAVQGSKYPSPYLWMFGENSTLPVNRTVYYTSGLVLSGEHKFYVISTFPTLQLQLLVDWLWDCESRNLTNY